MGQCVSEHSGRGHKSSSGVANGPLLLERQADEGGELVRPGRG